MSNCCVGGDKEGEKKEQAKKGSLTKKKQKMKCAKIVLLESHYLIGNVAVGKTSLTQRYAHDKFEEKYYNTLGAAYVEKEIEKNGEQYQLSIWDTAGDERYRSIMPLYYRDAQVGILVYDVTDAQSFNDLDYWIEELDSKVKTDGLILALIGNKCDVPPENKRISKDMAQKYATEKNLLFQECSAKTGEGILSIFQQIINKIEFQQA